MARNPLAVLWRLRDAATAQAKRDLAAARAAELDGQARLDGQHALLSREQALCDSNSLDQFGRWLPLARAEAARLAQALAERQLRAEAAQRALALRRVEAEAVAKALERQQDRAMLDRQRKEQAAMDEAASRPGSVRRPQGTFTHH